MTKTRILVGLCVLGAALWYAQRPPHSPPAESRLSITERAAAQRHSADDAQLPSRRLIAADDLPPAGTRSLFDHHVARIGGLPFPFAALLDSFKPLDRWRQGTVSVLIPNGRSLAKAHADYQHPRVLAAAQLDPPATVGTIAPQYSGRLFLGYVERINTIEIIAYNEVAGRFEFQLVKDYCRGCTPRILYAKRDICMACHQSGGPIFAVRPWQETNAHRAVAQRIASARGVPWAQAHSTLYHGVPLSTQILMPESFDELVGLANRLTLGQRAWLDGCGDAGAAEGLACRRTLLEHALSLLMQPGDFDPDHATRALRDAGWPRHSISVPETALVDRQPPPPLPAHAALLQRWTRVWSEWRAPPGRTDDTDARLAAFDRLPRPPVELDPLSARPPKGHLRGDTAAGIQAVARLFSHHDRELLLELSAADPERIRSVIQSGTVDPALSAAPLNRVAILQRLSAALEHPTPDYCCLDTAALAPAGSDSGRPLPITPGSVLEVFERYCFDCHRGNPVDHLNFMDGATEADVLASIREKQRIRTVLDYARHANSEQNAQLMPPPHSEQRLRLDAARASGSDDLQRMLATVPPPAEP